MRFISCGSGLAALLFAATAQAQSLKNIGVTSAGTPVFLETKSVTKASGIITATLRTELKPPIKTSTGDMVSIRSVSMFDCAKQTSAMKERWFYYDAKGTKQARYDKPMQPGYGSAIKGSIADVGLAYLCAQPAKP